MPKYPISTFAELDIIILINLFYLIEFGIWTLKLKFLKSMAPTISDTPLSNRYVWVSANIISTSIIQLRKKTSLACSKKNMPRFY